MPSPLALELLAAPLGLLCGSFLNVCIERLPLGESVVTPRSRCPHCRAPIAWSDNIPVLSWLLLHARCRHCRAPISARYPLVELVLAAWFIITTARLLPLFRITGPAPLPFETLATAVLSSIAFATLGFLLLGLLIMDWRTQRLSDAFTLGGTLLAFLLLCSQAIFLGPTEDQVHLTRAPRLSSPGSTAVHGNLILTGPEALLGGRLVAIAAAALVLLTIRWLYARIRGRQGMGLGDVKLLAMIAAFLGFAPAMLSLFLGVVAGGFYGSVLLATRRAGALSRLPLGSFLAAGGLLSALFGQQILGWYKSLF